MAMPTRTESQWFRAFGIVWLARGTVLLLEHCKSTVAHIWPFLPPGRPQLGKERQGRAGQARSAQ
eukprot:6323409-Lingulodinium_polyedra.AAC.1